MSKLQSGSGAEDLRSELLEATALLQKIAGSKDMLRELTSEERAELLNAAGDVFCADPEERRLRVKLRRRRQRAEKAGSRRSLAE